MVKQSQHVSEAARDLVRHDAEARHEIVLVHADLVRRLDKQRSVVEEAREPLEQESREIAHRRSRDPVIARAVESICLAILCLVPVAVSLYVIRQMTHARTSPDYPQSNGKIERWRKSVKVEGIRPGVPLSMDLNTEMDMGYVNSRYEVRLHGATGHVPPRAVPKDRAEVIQA